MRLQGIFYARFYFKTLAYESKGRRFESCRGHHCNVDTAIICGVFLFLGNKCQFDTGNIWGKIIKLERKFLRSNFI